MAAITGADGEHIPAASGPAAANTPAVVNIPARPGWRVVLGMLSVSYTAAPAAGRVAASDGSGAPLDLDVTAAGLTPLQIPDGGIRFNPSQAVQVVLAAGGAAVVGKISLAYRYVRAEG